MSICPLQVCLAHIARYKGVLRVVILSGEGSLIEALKKLDDLKSASSVLSQP